MKYDDTSYLDLIDMVDFLDEDDNYTTLAFLNYNN